LEVLRMGKPFHSQMILLIVIGWVLVGCGQATVPPPHVTLQAALPTPTLEPTFTPAPPPTNTAQSLPTTTVAEPTPTPIPQSALSGRIFDQDTHQPIPGAKVSAGTTTDTTDVEGRYTLTDLPPGQYVLSVTHEDYDPGLSSIFTLAVGQEHSLDLALYAPDASPYPKDPMLTNPLDPNGAPTAEDAERLARKQGLTGEMVDIRETKLSGKCLVNYRIGDEVRAAVADLNHEVWELTDDAGRKWWIIKVCGNLASPLPAEVAVTTPEPRPLPPMAEVLVDDLIVRACASEECDEVGVVQRGMRVEIVGCSADRGWCQVGLPGGGSGWCTGQSLRHLAVAEAVPVIEAIVPSRTQGDKIAFLSDRDHPNSSTNWRQNHTELYIMNLDGTQQQRMTSGLGVNTLGAWLTWRPNSSQILVDAYGSWTLVNVETGGFQKLAGPKATEWQAYQRLWPEWSPSGEWLVYSMPLIGPLPPSPGSPPASIDIFISRADGTDARQITASYPGVTRYSPSWSPDEQMIVFTHYKGYLKPEQEPGTGRPPTGVYTISVDGASVKQIMALDTTRVISWSPDGAKIAFENFHEGGGFVFDIWIADSDGTNARNLTQLQGNISAWSPRWSPNGTKIAFDLDDGKSAQVYTINPDGTGLTQLTFEGNNCCPAWSR
jgi:Tol biopolymer transport system component